jgi:D-inositol-3-phosphate glycosyltransferase
MSESVSRVAMVSMHTAPDAPAGSADAGGMNVSILATSHELAARGVEVDLITRATDMAGSRLVAPGITLHSLAAGPRRPVPKNDLMHYADEFGEQLAGLAGRAGARYDVIHAHYWLSGLASLPVALELGIPFVQSYHTLAVMKNANLAPGDRPEPERRLWVESYLGNQADAIIAGSSAEVAAIMDEVRAPGDRLWIIPPGVDAEQFTPLRRDRAGATRERLGLPVGRPIVTVVGRVQPLKGQDLVLRALAEMNERPVLAIAGEATPGSDDYAEMLAEYAVSHGISRDVVFLGRLGREDIADLMAASALVLVPSHSETFGLVAIEAAASGTPAIGYRSGGLSESIDEGGSGILLDSRDPAEWAAAIGGLLGNPRRLMQLSTTARAFAEQFSWATAATSLLGIYAALGSRARH